jgi:hypothetical protein
MFNVNQITSELARMADPMPQKYAAMHKDDPYTVALAVGESNRRKSLRTAAQAKMAGMQQPKVVDQDIAEMAAVDPMGNVTGALPEDTGIGKLAAPNLKRMADGGIAGYAEGGNVEHFRRGGVSDDDIFNQAFLRTLKYEGGRTNDTGGDTKYGISKKNNPDVDIDKLTIEGARRLYKERYWDAISGDKLAARDPKLAQVAFDTAVNQGVSKAKQFVTESGGDPTKLMQLRGEHYDNLVQKNPEKYGAFARGWASRLGNLATDLAIPSAVAGEVTKTGAPTAAPAAPEDKRAWYDRYRDLAMSGEAQKAILHGVQDVPAALLGAPVDISYAIANKLGRNEVAGEKPIMGSQYLKEKFGQMGIRAPESTNPDLQNIREATTGITTLYNPLSEATTAGKMTKSGIDTLRKENTAAAVNAARTEAEATGALSAEAKLAEEAEAARRAALSAEAPTKATAIQKANEMAQASRAPVAKNLNPVGEAALLADAEIPLSTDQQVAPAATATTAAPANTPIDKEGIDKLLKEDKGAASAIAEKGGLAGLFKDPAFLMGMNLMASQNPRFLGGLGEAGMGTAKALGELRRAEAEQGYYGARGAEAQATADLYNRGAKDRNMQLEAEKLVQKGMEDWAKSTAGKLGGINNPQAAQMEESRLRRTYYQQLGLPLVPLQSDTNVPQAGGGGFKLLGVRPS